MAGEPAAVEVWGEVWAEAEAWVQGANAYAPTVANGYHTKEVCRALT